MRFLFEWCSAILQQLNLLRPLLGNQIEMHHSTFSLLIALRYQLHMSEHHKLVWISNLYLTLKMTSAQELRNFSELISPGWSNSIQVSFVVDCLPSSLQPVMRKKITTPRELRSHQFLNCYEWLRRYLKWEQFFQNGTTKRNFLRKTLTIIRKHTSSSLYVQEAGWINCFKSRSNNFTICLQGFHAYVTTLFELLR